MNSGSSADGRGAAAAKAASGDGSRGGLAVQQQPEGLRSISVDRGRMMIKEAEKAGKRAPLINRVRRRVYVMLATLLTCRSYYGLRTHRYRTSTLCVT